MKHNLNYDDEHSILMLEINGEYTREEAFKIGELYQKFFAGAPYRQLIVNLQNAGKLESRETRQITKDKIDEAGITDVAYVGASAATRMIARVLMKLGGQKATSNFLKSYDEAIQWLKSRRK